MSATEGWTFKKEISFGDLIKSIMIAGAVFAWGMTVENRFVEQNGYNNLTKAEMKHIQQEIEFNRLSIETMREEIRDGFDRLYDKLDSKADK